MTLPDVTEAAGQPTEPSIPAIHLPRPTAWPMLLAAGVTMVLAGLITNPIFIVAGVAAAGFSLAGWFKEVRHEHDA